MKKVLMVLGCLVFMLEIGNAQVIKFPDGIETNVCSFYDMQNGISGVGIVSPIISISVFDINVGYANFNNSIVWASSVSFDLDNLNKIGVKDIQYLWQGLVKTKLALWIGFSKENKELRAGVSATVIQIKF